MSYNGWTNYETWNVALWLNNDYGEYMHWRERTSEAVEGADDTAEAVRSLEDELKGYIQDETNPLADDASMFSDLLSAALRDVNYYEIAEHWVEDYQAEHVTS